MATTDVPKPAPIVSGNGAGAVQELPVPVPVVPKFANAGPLGLAAFALTTFLLSAKNAKWTDGTDAWLGYALAYGGFVQLLAGMWEFRNRNVFGATAFSTYGGFWIGLGLYALLLGPHAAATGRELNDLGWILLAFAIFNTYMLLLATRLTLAVFLVFLTLEVTEILLFLGAFAGNAPGSGLTSIGGWVGILTAIVAWYTSFATIANTMRTRPILPVGGPLWADREAAATRPLVPSGGAS